MSHNVSRSLSELQFLIENQSMAASDPVANGNPNKCGRSAEIIIMKNNFMCEIY